MRLTDAPITEQKAFQTWVVNWGPWPEKTSAGILCCQKTCCFSNLAASVAVGSLGRAVKWTALEIQSIMVKMTVLPWEVVRPVTKSSAICDQGCLGKQVRGFSQSTYWTGRDVLLGVSFHSWPPEVALRGSEVTADTRTTGETLKHWTHCRTTEWTESGTNKQFGEPLPASGWACCACLILASTSQEMTAATEEAGGIVSGQRTDSIDTNWWERASDLTFIDPEQ